MAERSETDKQTAEGILSWLDIPAPALSPDRLAAFKAWWPKLPDPVKTAIKEAVSLEKEPGADDFIRIAEITDLRVTNADLKNVEWSTMLTKLDDLNVSGNTITDLSPVAKLTKLTDLDASENKIRTLAPIAGMKRSGGSTSARTRSARSKASSRCRSAITCTSPKRSSRASSRVAGWNRSSS